MIRTDIRTIACRILLAGVVIWLSAIASSAQTSYPFLYSLYPCGLQRGQTAEITLSGAHNYHSAYRVLIEGQGVTGEVVPPAGGWPGPDEKTKAIPQINEIQLKLTAAPDAPLGIRELRVVTPRGVSSVGLIVVGDEPERLEKEPNNTLEQAEQVTFPVTVNGRIQQGEDIDTYKFKVKAGEAITFCVLCARLEDKIHDLQTHADPLLTLRDATGRELASNDDYFRADPLLHYRFEKEGEYFLQIRDVNYAGDPRWTYRLTMTRGPFVTAFLPLAVNPGTTLDVTPVGFNLPAGQPARLEVPANTPPGEYTTLLKTPDGPSNPISVLVTDLPVQNLRDSPPVHAPYTLNLPVVVSARLRALGEQHRYTFHAAKGQTYTFEINARRLGSPIDSALTLLDPQGNEITGNDDAGSPDSRIDWTAPAEGEYTLLIRDLHRHGGENFVYLLTAQVAHPDFTLRCDDDKMKLGPGNSGAWYILVDRKFGFDREIHVEVKGLPPGVSAHPLTIPPNVSQGCLILSCAPDAKMGVSPVEVIGTAHITGPDGKTMTLTRRATPLSEIYIPGGGRGMYPVNTQAVAVTEGSDIQIELNTTRVKLEPGGTARIDVTIKRAPGYTKPVTLDVYLRHLGSIYGNPLPPGVSLDEGASKTLLGPEETQGHIVLKAAPNATPVTDLPIAVLGAVSINFVVKVSYAGPPVLLTVAPKS